MRCSAERIIKSDTISIQLKAVSVEEKRRKTQRSGRESKSSLKESERTFVLKSFKTIRFQSEGREEKIQQIKGRRCIRNSECGLEMAEATGLGKCSFNIAIETQRCLE